MEKKIVALTQDEIRTGQIITERAKKHLAAFEALRDTESDYMTQLRDKYKLGPEWLVNDWMQGFECVPEEVAEIVTNDKNN